MIYKFPVFKNNKFLCDECYNAINTHEVIAVVHL